MAGRKKKGKNAIQGFSRRLSESRRGQYTQAQLAEIVDVSDQTIKKYEAGERQPDSFDIIVALAKALHVTTDYLLGASSEQNAKVRDIASFIGVSQPAAEKLDELARRNGQRTFPLNALIMNHRFEELIYLLWILHEESRIVQAQVETEDLGRPHCYDFKERTLSGSALLQYDLDRVTNLARELFAEICMVNDATAKHDSAVYEALEAEYLKQVGGDKNGEKYGKRGWTVLRNGVEVFDRVNAVECE